MDYADLFKRASSFEDVREILFMIRCKSRREQLSPEETRFCERCMSRWGDDYRAMSGELFAASATKEAVVQTPKDRVLERHPEAKAVRSGDGWSISAPTMSDSFHARLVATAWELAAAAVESTTRKPKQ